MAHAGAVSQMAQKALGRAQSASHAVARASHDGTRSMCQLRTVYMASNLCGHDCAVSGVCSAHRAIDGAGSSAHRGALPVSAIDLSGKRRERERMALAIITAAEATQILVAQLGHGSTFSMPSPSFTDMIQNMLLSWTPCQLCEGVWLKLHQCRSRRKPSTCSSPRPYWGKLMGIPPLS